MKDVGLGFAEVTFGLRTLSMIWMTPFAINMSVVVMRAELRKKEFELNDMVRFWPCSVRRVVPLAKSELYLRSRQLDA